jgi:hypothetical protein
MKLRKLGLLASVLGAFLGFGSAAHAQWSGSFTDMGVVYTLSDTTPGSNTTHTYTLVLNTSGYTGPAGAFLDSVNIKAWNNNAGPSNVLSFTFSAPSGSSWLATEGAIGNGGGGTGCASGTAGFTCIEAATKGVFSVGPTYTFGFTVTAANATDFLTSNIGPKVGAGYANAAGDGQGYGIVSVTMIPEPEIYAMLLAGLGLMGFVARRRHHGSAAA